MFINNNIENLNIYTVSMKKCNSSQNKNRTLTFDKANKTDISKFKNTDNYLYSKNYTKNEIKMNIFTHLFKKRDGGGGGGGGGKSK